MISSNHFFKHFKLHLVYSSVASFTFAAAVHDTIMSVVTSTRMLLLEVPVFVSAEKSPEGFEV